MSIGVRAAIGPNITDKVSNLRTTSIGERMWPNNGFQGHGNFQQNYSDDSYIPFSPVTLGQQYFQNLRHSQSVPYNDHANSKQSTPGEFQPEVGLYDEEAFAHGQFRGSSSSEEYIPQRHSIAIQGTPRPTLNARAEELKAQLLKSKERAKSGTPPVSATVAGSKPSNTIDGTKSFRESPNTPGNSPDELPTLSRRTSAILDNDLDDLIFQAQAAAHVKEERTQSSSTPSKLRHSPMLESTIKPQIRNEESSAKLSTPGINDTNSHARLVRQIIREKESNGDLSDVSEGEIQEEPRTKNKSIQPSAGLKDKQSTARPFKPHDQVLRKPDEQNRKAAYSLETRETSPYKNDSVPKSRVIAPRLFDERHEESEERFDRRSRQTSDKYERKHQPEPEQRSYLRHDIRDVPEDQRKQETKNAGNKENVLSRKQEVPTLAQLLLVDEDLKDWLDVTGYHNAEYRNKILNRRRAIAALDAQKAKLLEEMEIEERGGVPPGMNTQVSAAGMLPPPIPSKMGAAASSVRKADDIATRTETERSSSKTSNQDSGPKRTYSEYRGSEDDGDVEKVGRPDDRDRAMGIRIKSDNHTEDHRLYSSGPDSSHRRSTSDDNKTFRRDERDSYDEDRGRDRGRTYDRPHNHSPPQQGHDRSLPAKIRKHEFSSPEERDDRGDWKNRPFVMRGNYRGRAYDPNYRGRGRGRGGWNELGEGRFERRESQPSQPFAQRLAFMKPYKDPKPLELGRRGDTKFFIVKSFNEENVVRCIEDSIWTTQVENGEIFKAAFLKYKNVILVFSVNQSRAFQGYARMESVPGSEEAPQWQNNINWESAGAFKVRWICVANTRFHRVGHIKNRLNENQPVLVGRDGQEIEELAGEELLKLIDEEADRLLTRNSKEPVPTLWDE